MKNTIYIFVLLSALLVWQACNPKAEEANEKSEAATAKIIQTKKADDIAAKRTELIKQRVQKEEQRKLAIAEKAKVSPTFKDASGKVVFYKAEVDPSYEGGINEMRKFLKNNLKYPANARNQELEGTVFVDFIVDEKGRVRQVESSDVLGEYVDASFQAGSRTCRVSDARMESRTAEREGCRYIVQHPDNF